MPGQAAAVIAESNLDVVPHRVGARVAFVHSLTIGLGVVEHHLLCDPIEVDRSFLPVDHGVQRAIVLV